MLMGLNFNKIMALGTIILVCSSFVFVSCKGASSRKAAIEALEMIEKRSGKFGEAAEREAGSMERSVEENYNNSMLKNKRRVDRIREALDGDDEEYTPQQTLITCPVCKGNRAVYITDEYGRVQFDPYGNPLSVTCTNCRGAGQVVVYQ